MEKAYRMCHNAHCFTANYSVTEHIVRTTEPKCQKRYALRKFPNLVDNQQSFIIYHNVPNDYIRILKGTVVAYFKVV